MTDLTTEETGYRERVLRDLMLLMRLPEGSRWGDLVPAVRAAMWRLDRYDAEARGEVQSAREKLEAQFNTWMRGRP